MILDFNTYRLPVRDMAVDEAEELRNITMSRLIRMFEASTLVVWSGELPDDAFDNMEN